MRRDGFQLDGSGPEDERYLVPAFFAPCADELLASAEPLAGRRVLDLACGTGVVARRLAARVGAAGTVVGVDVNPAMVAYAAWAAGGDGAVPVTWHTADAAALPLPDGAVDLACCQQGLQFFHDRTGALREAHRVLANGGRITLAMWRPIEHNPVFAVLVDVLDRHVGAEAAGVMRGPFAGPALEDLRGLLEQSGFGDVRARIAGIWVRFPSTREFLRREVESTPLATARRAR